MKYVPCIFYLLPCRVNALKISFHFFRQKTPVLRHGFCVAVRPSRAGKPPPGNPPHTVPFRPYRIALQNISPVIDEVTGKLLAHIKYSDEFCIACFAYDDFSNAKSIKINDNTILQTILSNQPRQRDAL